MATSYSGWRGSRRWMPGGGAVTRLVHQLQVVEEEVGLRRHRLQYSPGARPDVSTVLWMSRAPHWPKPRQQERRLQQGLAAGERHPAARLVVEGAVPLDLRHTSSTVYRPPDQTRARSGRAGLNALAAAAAAALRPCECPSATRGSAFSGHVAHAVPAADAPQSVGSARTGRGPGSPGCGTTSTTAGSLSGRRSCGCPVRHAWRSA